MALFVSLSLIDLSIINKAIFYHKNHHLFLILFAPKFKRLAQDERFEGITFLDVDAEENPEARKLGNVKNLPTLAIFKNGELEASLASNKEDAVVELMNKLN